MLEISFGSISLTRGDTAKLDIKIRTANGDDYIINEDDTLKMTIRKSIKDKTYILQKTITGENIFYIKPDDTSNLDFGNYMYDVELTTSAGDVYTVIPPHSFCILEEVTY